MRRWRFGLVLLCACGGRTFLDGAAPRVQGDAGAADVGSPTVPAEDGGPPPPPAIDAGKDPTRECPDDAPEPAVLLSDETLISDLAVDRDWVYWSTLEGTVKRMPRCGGAVTDLASRGYWGQSRVAVDETYFYWTSNSEILRIPKGGGAVDDFTSTTRLSFAVDDTSLYAFRADGLWKYPLDGTRGAALYDVSVDSTSGTITMTTTSSNIYVVILEQPWTTTNVIRVPKNGGGAEIVRSMPALYVTGLAADDSDLYFGTYDTSATSLSIVRAPLDGSPMETIASAAGAPGNNSFEVLPNVIRLDDTRVYWAGQVDTKTILFQRMAKSGGEAETLLEKDYPSDGRRESFLVLDDVYAYVSLGDGMLYRVKR